MAISLVGTPTTAASIAGSSTCAVPTGVAAGDLLVARYATRTSAAQNLPVGWTLHRELLNSTSPGLRASIAYRVAGGSEPANYTFSASASVSDAVVMAAFRGVDTASPFSVSGTDYTEDTQNSSTTITGPDLTTEDAGAWLVFLTANTANTVPSTPSGMTLAATATTPSGGTGQVTAGMFYEARPTAGATGSRAATLSTARITIGHMTALKPAAGTVPTAPTGLSATPTPPIGIDLAWTPGTGQTSQRIERRLSPAGSWGSIGVVGAATATATDTSGAHNTSYDYRIVGVNGTGDSTPSTTATALTHPAAATGLSATALTATSVQLTWTAPGAAAASLTVQRSPAGLGSWGTLVTGLASSTTSYLDSTASGGTSYDYQILSVNASGSVASAPASATTPAGIPMPLGSFGGAPRLQVLLRSAPREAGGIVIADLTPWLTEATIAADPYGDRDCQLRLDRPLPEALGLYLRHGPLHVEVVAGDHAIWEGRISEPALVARERAGVAATAVGYWAAYADLQYVGVWSDSDLTRWRVATTRDRPALTDKRFIFDQPDTLFVGLKEGANYTTGTIGGYWAIVPDASVRTFTGISLTVTILLPVGYGFRVSYFVGSNLTTAVGTTVSTTAGTGAAVTTTLNLTWAPTGADAILIDIAPTGSATYTGQDGDHFVEVTAARTYAITTVTPPGALDPATIVAGMQAYVASKNPSQVGEGTSLILSTGRDHIDAWYEDRTPADILTELAALGDGTTPWLVGVTSGRRLFFHPPGTNARAWAAIASELELRQNRSDLANAIYATYTDGRDRTRRTATATDAASIARYGLRRERMVQSDGASVAQAQAARDAALFDAATPPPQASWRVRQLTTLAGVPVPPWLLRPGDTITETSLSPTYDGALDRLRTFRVAETRYNLLTNELDVTPEAALPSLVATR